MLKRSNMPLLRSFRNPSFQSDSILGPRFMNGYIIVKVVTCVIELRCLPRVNSAYEGASSGWLPAIFSTCARKKEASGEVEASNSRRMVERGLFWRLRPVNACSWARVSESAFIYDNQSNQASLSLAEDVVRKRSSRTKAQLSEHKVESHVDSEPKGTQSHHVQIRP